MPPFLSYTILYISVITIERVTIIISQEIRNCKLRDAPTIKIRSIHVTKRKFTFVYTVIVLIYQVRKCVFVFIVGFEKVQFY